MKLKSILLVLIIPAIICFIASTSAAESTWQSVGPFGGSVTVLAIDPNDSQTVYAKTDAGGPFKSTNGGASWTLADNGITTSGSIKSLVIDPHDSQTVYMGISGTYGGGLYKSTNGGELWAAANPPAKNNTPNISFLALDPNDTRTVYVGMVDNLWVAKSTDGCASWSSGFEIPNRRIYSLVIDPNDSQTFYTVSSPYTDGSSVGIFKSTNRGASWAVANNGIPNSTYNSVAIDPKDSQTLYVGTAVGLFKSTNAGALWTLANSGITSTSITSVAIDPTQNQTIYAGTLGGLFKSINGGLSWNAANSGITSIAINSIVIDPINSQAVYAGTNKGINKSITGGATWSGVKSNFGSISAQFLAIDPTDSQTVYTGNGGELLKSINSGASWIAANNGITSAYIRNIVFDPNNSQTIYAGTNEGVFKTTNGGASWTTANAGITSSSIVSLVIDPTNSLTVYAKTSVGYYKTTNGGTSWTLASSGMASFGSITIAPTDSQTMYGINGGLFKSSNGGVSWTKIPFLDPLGMSMIHAIVIDPTDSKTVYLALEGGFISKTTDGGATWTPASKGIDPKPYSAIYSLAIDPTNRQTVYAGTDYKGIYKSINGGASWTAFNSGMLNSVVYSIDIDPIDSKKIYARTSMGIFKTVSTTTPTVSGPAFAFFNINNPGSFKVSTSGWPSPILSVSGDLPNGLSFDPSTGILSGTPSIGSAGKYTLLFTAGNGIPPDACKAVTVTVLASSALTVTIAAPVNNATVASLAGISGTASGSGLSKVEIQVTDGTYYLQSNNTFTTNSDSWLTATGTNTWSRSTVSAPWVEGITYTITARAVGSSGSTKITTSTFSIQPSASKAGAILSFTLTPESIKAGEKITLNGSLVQTNTTPIAGKTVTFIITPPATLAVPNPAPIISTYTSDSNGNFSGLLNQFATPGVYMVKARFDGDATYQASSSTQPLGVTPKSGYAIIVVGKSPTDSSLFDQHLATATTVYNTLTTKRGFLDSDIDSDIKTLISNKTGAAVTKQQIQKAITEWARDKIVKAPAPLYLIMIDHGTTEGFVLGTETLTPDELSSKDGKGYLDTLESDPAVIASGALASYNRFVIIGTCNSGAFVSKISKPGRVVVSSAAANELSLSGFPIYDSSKNALLNGGENFIDALFNFLGRGDSFKDAFQESTSMLSLRDPRKVPLGTHSGVYDTLAQHPLLNDSGNGTGSYHLDSGVDGTLAATLTLGVGIKAIGDPADIQAVTPTAFLSTDQTTIDPFWLQVNDNSRVARAWVEIRTPNTTTTSSGSGQVTPNLVTRPLIYDGISWIGMWSGFTVPGAYDILYYTQDNLTDDISPAAHSVVYKQKTGNAAPKAFSLISPANNGTVTPIFPLTWTESGSLNNNTLTYTLQVSTDESFNTLIYTADGIHQPATYIADAKLKNPNTGLYYCQNGQSYCYWKIKAIDSYGAVTESDIHRFTIVSTSGQLNSIVTGVILNNATAAPISSATVLLASATGQPTSSTGSYMFGTPNTGSTTPTTITVEATGYKTRTVPITLNAGTAVSSTIYLEPEKASQTIGTINFTPSTVIVGGTTTISTTASSGLAITFTSTTPGVCTINGTIVTTLSTGTCTITADQAGNDSYNAAPQVSGSIVPGKVGQAVTNFAPPSNKTYGDAAIILTATGGSSGNPVTYSVVSGPGSVSGTNNASLTITGAGTIVVRASQAGNTKYAAAQDVTASITVSPKMLTLTANNASRAYAVANPTNPGFTAPGLVGTDNIGSVTYTYAVTATVTAAVGTTHSITPSSAAFTVGSAANYSITYATGTLTIAGTASQVITNFAPPSSKAYGNAAINLTATGGASGNPVTYSVVSGPGSVSGTNNATLNITGAGTIVVKASQVGITNYAAAPDVTASITVSPKALTITANNASRAYAVANPTNPGFTAPGFVGTDNIGSMTYTYAVTASATAAVGTTHGITPSAAVFTSGSAANYNITYATGTLTIAGTASQVITNFAPPSSKAYGNAAINLTATGGASGNPVTYSVVSGPGSVSDTNNATLTITGAGTIVVKASQAGNINYAAAPDVTASITVSPKMLTLTANNASRAYAVANPTNPGFTAPGLVGTDNIGSVTYTYAVTASATAAVGSTHLITPSVALFTSGSTSNYNITYATGTLTIVGNVQLPAKPGDCDGDGTVTIAEVQSAINMFLGLKAVEACVDTDNSTLVSISEVQKTINAFLGL